MRQPLVGEPTALDLVNTEWVSAGERYDLLASPRAARAWVRRALPGEAAPSERALGALVELRAALRAYVRDPDDAAARAALNAFLARGRVRVGLGPAGPEEQVEAAPDDRVPFLIARQFVGLLAAAPERVRACANPACLLAFFDTSKNGARRWCSMRACGNVEKARRHQARAAGAKSR